MSTIIIYFCSKKVKTLNQLTRASFILISPYRNFVLVSVSRSEYEMTKRQIATSNDAIVSKNGINARTSVCQICICIQGRN